ncbi:hypothetical protein NM688_g3044 [Phlebia brevispora]|uniref:Uncharacterized protein n=1 Tax=Phlebia brevispora TaxID=194682 RepID=A0ACC1T732_9APHY|nr:hypothetical protein NM688_g3044 [Phlebia brevispora]
MPGPRNARKKRRVQVQKEKERRQKTTATTARCDIPSILDDIELICIDDGDLEPELNGDHILYQPLRSRPLRYSYTSTTSPAAMSAPHDTLIPDDYTTSVQYSTVNMPEPCDNSLQPARLCHPDGSGDRFPGADVLLKRPCIEDTGTGLQVLDVLEFVFDSRLASPPSLDDALCAEFAQEEVLDMLCVVLPEEIATILWYNKSRQTARICPVCKRLYRVGEALRQPGEHSPSWSNSDFPRAPQKPASSHAKRRKEQEISGICSTLCFFLAAHQYPTAVRSMWGRMVEELDDETRAELDLNSLSSLPIIQDDSDSDGKSSLSLGLGILFRMTRCSDLDLKQIFFSEQDLPDAAENAP